MGKGSRLADPRVLRVPCPIPNSHVTFVFRLELQFFGCGGLKRFAINRENMVTRLSRVGLRLRLALTLAKMELQMVNKDE